MKRAAATKKVSGTSGTSLTKVSVRRTTYAKLDQIRRAKRWTFVETVDAIADEFRNRHASELQTAAS